MYLSYVEQLNCSALQDRFLSDKVVIRYEFILIKLLVNIEDLQVETSILLEIHSQTSISMFKLKILVLEFSIYRYAVAETSVCKCKGLLILKYLVEVGKYWVDYMKLGVENIQGPASAFPRILGHEAAG